MIRAVRTCALSVSLLAGCAPTTDTVSPSAGDPPERRVVFLCDRGQSITVGFQGNTAVLESGGTSARLRARTVASGLHYAGGGHDLRGKGPELVWTDPTGATRNCRDQEWAMRQPQVQELPARLEGTSWRLLYFQSSDDAIGKVLPPRVERYTLTFGAEGMLAMKLDCNQASAHWQASPSSAQGGSLSITPGPMTRAMCGAGAIDTRLAQDMGKVRSFTLADGRLGLALAADAGIYLWEPAGNADR